MLSLIADDHTEKWVFQKVAAAIHSIIETKSLLATHIVTVMPWPAKIPDFNPLKFLLEVWFGQGKGKTVLLQL